jgi:hypothetical protein
MHTLQKALQPVRQAIIVQLGEASNIVVSLKYVSYCEREPDVPQ